MWIIPWDLVLQKKLLNKGTCGSCEQCAGPTQKTASARKRAKFASQMEAIYIYIYRRWINWHQTYIREH